MIRDPSEARCSLDEPGDRFSSEVLLMSYVVTRLCRGNKDTSCVAVCPVDCFYVPNAATAELPDQLYISPAECINCSACVDACPWQAIFDEGDVPAAFADDTALNAR